MVVGSIVFSLNFKRLKESRRGQFVQLVLFVVVFVVFAFIFVASNMAGNKINDMIQTSDMDSQSKSVMQSNTDSQPLVFDSGGVFILVIVWLLLLGLAYNAPTNPFLAVAVIVILVALGFVGMILSNMWNSMYTDADLATYAHNFPIMNMILQNYLVVILLMGFSSFIVYNSRRGMVG